MSPMRQHSYADRQQQDSASLYAAQAQDFYPADMKGSVNVMSADSIGSTVHSGATSSAPAAGGSDVPTQLTQDEMARLADLVAHRMREHADPAEPPPMYR